MQARVAPRPRMKKTFMLATMYDILLTVVWSNSRSMELPACENCFFELCLHYARIRREYAHSKRFMIIHEGGGGGGSKCDVIKRGGEDYCDDSVTEGGEGVQNSLNLCDVIYERPPHSPSGEGVFKWVWFRHVSKCTG